MNKDSSKTIGIVGGGFTGLTAGYELAKAGFKVKIIEASEYLGGLAGNFRIERQNIEMAYHHLFKTDQFIINLTKELRLENELMWFKSSVCVVTKHKKTYPFTSPIDLIKFKEIDFFSRIRGGLVTLFLKMWKNWEKLEKLSAISWMEKWSGKAFTQTIWRPLLKGKFGNYYTKISMAWLWARIHIRANSRDKGVSYEELGYYKHGFKILVDKLAEKIKELGGDIITNTFVDSIQEDQDKRIILKTLDNQLYTFDSVIFTTPSNVFYKIMQNSNKHDNEYCTKLKDIEYLNAVTLVFTSTQDISKFYWHNILDENAPFLVFINHTKLVPKDWYNNINVYYIGAYVSNDDEIFSMNEEKIREKWFSFLKEIFNNFDNSQVKESYVFKFKNAQHIVDKEYRSKIPPYDTHIDRVYLANFSQVYPEDRGTNYAVREGIKIAKIIKENLVIHK